MGSTAGSAFGSSRRSRRWPRSIRGPRRWRRNKAGSLAFPCRGRPPSKRIQCVARATAALSEAGAKPGTGSVKLEHFPEKWSPVFRQKMRPPDKTRALSGLFEPESTLKREARAAAARSLGLWIVHAEGRADQVFDEIDLGPGEIGERHGVDEQRRLIMAHHHVI